MALLTPSGKLGTAICWVSGIVKNHEMLLAIGLGVALVWGVTGKVQSIIAAHDQKVYDKDAIALQATAEKNAALAQTSASLAAQYQQALTQTQQANAALAQANAALSTALMKQKAVDASLPPPQLATRIETMAGAPAGSITPLTNALSITLPAAVIVAQKLEEVPVLQQQLDNTTAQKASTEKLLIDQTTRVDGLNEQITGLKLEATQSDKVCTDKLKVEKDKAAKAKRRYLVIGGIIGALAEGIGKRLLGL